MKYGKLELKRRLQDVLRKKWTDTWIVDLIDSLWRDDWTNRTSGFEFAGGPDAEISFDSSTRIFAIEPAVKKFSYYQFEDPVFYFKRSETDSVQLPELEGLYLIYFDQDEEDEQREQKLFALRNPSEGQVKNIYLNRVIVAWVYWAIPGGVVYFGDERHGSEWNPQIHWWAHNVFNGLRQTGLLVDGIANGDGSENAHARFYVQEGTFWHEDMAHYIYETISTQGLPVLYQSGAARLPRFINNGSFAVDYAPEGRLRYNDNGQRVRADNNRYVLCHVIASNCLVRPVFAVMGRAQYKTEYDAIRAWVYELDEIIAWMPQQTRMHVATLVYHTDDSYTNTPRARITGEVTPERLAEAIAAEAAPYKKTGWTPNIQKEATFTASDQDATLTINADPGPALHFIDGTRFFVEESPINAAIIDNVTGLQYVKRNAGNFEFTLEPFSNYETSFAMAAALYWNSRFRKFIYVGWRMHSYEMLAATRGNTIKKTGLELVSGLAVAVNTDEGLNHTITVEEGTIRLADITAHISNNSDGIFAQILSPLEARRYFLLTYQDEEESSGSGSGSGETITSHEWDYQLTELNHVALLSGNSQVQINIYTETGWQLAETAEGEYSAMWLIATLDVNYPLKWITGIAAAPDTETAKELNGPETLLQIMNAARLVDYYAALARVIIKNIAEEPYYELAEIKTYDDGEFDSEVTDRYVTGIQFDNNTKELTLTRNAALPALRVTIPGGGDGTTGIVVTQPGHGFTIGQPVRHNGTAYVLAQANNDTNAQVSGFVAELMGTDEFRLIKDGLLPGEYTPGAEYFLSPGTAGQIITLPTPEEWEIGQVRLSVGWGCAEGLLVEIDVGDLIQEAVVIQGHQGPQGPQGDASTLPGPQGAQGYQGEKGNDGTSVNIIGSVATSGDLPVSGNTAGNGYLAADTGHLWVYDGTTWVDAGLIRGPEGPQGVQGVPGEASTMPGPQGPQGAQGASIAGPQGPQGEQGAAGSSGDSLWTNAGSYIYRNGRVVVGTTSAGTGKFYAYENAENFTGYFANASSSGRGVGIQAGSTVQPILSLSNWANTARFGFWSNGQMFAYALPAGVQSKVLYYNPTSKEITQGDISAVEGPQGAQGVPGDEGPQGAQGRTPAWYAGSNAPDSAFGFVGDWYLRGPSGDVYEKTGTSTWTLKANIRGPQGTTGEEGAQGPQGLPGSGGDSFWARNNGYIYPLTVTDNLVVGKTSGFTSGKRFEVAGDCIATGTWIASNFILNSSRKIKTDIARLVDTEWTDRIELVSFKMNNDLTRTRYGVIAEDLTEVAPHLTDDSSGQLSVLYIDLLIAKLARMEQKIAELQKQ